MAPGLSDLIGVADWPMFVLVSARMAGLFLVAPVWSMAGIPRSVRAASVVLLSLVLLPVVPRVGPLPDDMVATAAVLAAETALGIAIGVTGSLIIHGVVIAGEVTSLQMGLSLGQALGALPEGATVGVGQLQGYFAMFIYLAGNGHLTLFQGLAASFAAIPPGHALTGLPGGRVIVDMTAAVFGAGVRAAAPVLVALLLANLALAILGKAVPQFNLMMVSFPITIAIGLMMLGASLPYLAAYLGGTVDALPAAIGRTIEGFTPAPAAP